MTSRTRIIETAMFLAIIGVFQQIPALAEPAVKSEKMKSRLEQLFVWRVSDKLSLTTKEEALFVDEYKKLGGEKQKLVIQADETLAQIEINKSDVKKSQQLVKEYISIQNKLNLVPSKEIQNIEKLFGSRRAAEYVLLKREMTQKFKDALTSTDRSSASASINH